MSNKNEESDEGSYDDEEESEEEESKGVSNHKKNVKSNQINSRNDGPNLCMTERLGDDEYGRKHGVHQPNRQ